MQAYGVEIMRTSSKPWYRKQNKTWYFKFGGKQVRLSRDKAEAKRKAHPAFRGVGVTSSSTNVPSSDLPRFRTL